MEKSEPPLREACKALFDATSSKKAEYPKTPVVEECELPLIDLSRLSLGGVEREECKREIVEASKDWGFFQVMKHGIPKEVLEKMRSKEVELFRHPFSVKSSRDFMNFSAGCYRWGTPSATTLQQLSWSEAFHLYLDDVIGSKSHGSFSSKMEKFTEALTGLGRTIAKILVEEMGYGFSLFDESWSPRTCYLRMNRYPPCPISAELYGLMPHTDSDFLTIVHQDQIGGLQLMRHGKWLAVKPNPEALIVNIGDLFQAWSNNVYKSVEHRVVPNKHSERFSIAFLLCPSYDTVIQSIIKPSAYKRFSFGEYRQQVEEDVRKFGCKIGLPRFFV